MIYLKTEEEIELLRRSNDLLGRTLAEVAKVIRPGVTTADLDKVAYEFICAPLILDSKKPTIPVAEYIYTENRYKQLTRSNPEVAKKLADDLQKEVDARYAFYDAMSKDTEGLISL